jgi:hypothetical protein
MRKFVLLLLLALALSVLVPASFAQDAPETFCGDLSAEDCDLLTQASEAEVNSGTANFNLQIDLQNIPDVPNLTISLAGDAAYNVDAAALESLSMDEATEMTAEESLVALTTALSAFDGELNLTLTLPEELAAEAGIPSSSIPLELALVDGIGYINFDTLDPLTGGMLAQQGLEGWGGINFIDLITQLVAENPEMLDQLDMASAGAGMTDMDMSQLEGLEQYVSVSRSADVDGQAVFVTDIDFGGFVSDPAFQDLIAESMESSGQAMSDAELQQALGILQVLGQQSSLSVTQSIDPATGFTTGGEFNLNMDLTSLLAASGETVDGEAFLSIVGTIDYSGLNDTTVTAPADANIAPTEMLLGTLSGSF